MGNCELTYKQLASRWRCCDKTARREAKRFCLPPAHFIGIQPVFSLAEVEKMEKRRLAQRAAAAGLSLNGKIITVKAAKKLAKR